MDYPFDTDIGPVGDVRDIGLAADVRTPGTVDVTGVGLLADSIDVVLVADVRDSGLAPDVTDV